MSEIQEIKQALLEVYSKHEQEAEKARLEYNQEIQSREELAKWSKIINDYILKNVPPEISEYIYVRTIEKESTKPTYYLSDYNKVITEKHLRNWKIGAIKKNVEMFVDKLSSRGNLWSQFPVYQLQDSKKVLDFWLEQLELIEN